MDPISSAIIAAVSRLAEPAVKDGYEGLKALLRKKFGSTGEIAKAVEKLEEKPASAARKALVEEEVVHAKADQDPEMVQAAHALVEKVRQMPAPQQLVKQTVTGDGNIIAGTGNVTLNRPVE
jgi:hypothetical protein